MTIIDQTIGYAPARCVKKSPFSGRFYYWLGASGERYLHTVFPIDAGFHSPGANLIVVRRAPDGERFALFVGRVGNLSNTDIERLRNSQGANELHIHLMATGDAAAHKIAVDLSDRLMTDAGGNSCTLPPKSLPAVFFTNISF